MQDYVLIIINVALINNFILAKFLGLCPLLGTSRRTDSAIGMSLATIFVLTLASALSYLVQHYLLLPYNLEYLNALVFILLIAIIVQLTEMTIHKINPLIHNILGIYLPLITTNCAVLAVTLINSRNTESFVEALFVGLGTAIGFAVVLIIFASLREKLEYADIPKPFRGAGIAMVTAGIMAIAFTGFSGLDSG
ncbi:MAG: electron transport complex subunit RsxA [Gammaproteobacteria bacterium]|nr:electron transport complex subunit RsxA [Gammaproteobacteria bacterium]